MQMHIVRAIFDIKEIEGTTTDEKVAMKIIGEDMVSYSIEDLPITKQRKVLVNSSIVIRANTELRSEINNYLVTLKSIDGPIAVNNSKGLIALVNLHGGTNSWRCLSGDAAAVRIMVEKFLDEHLEIVSVIIKDACALFGITLESRAEEGFAPQTVPVELEKGELK